MMAMNSMRAAVLGVAVLVLACDKGQAPDAATQSPPPAAANAPAATPAPAPASPPAAPDVAVAVAAVGQAAPAFSLPDLQGKTHALADYAGKTVVLEWFNPECPFVQYAHTKGPLVDMAKGAMAQGVVWLAVNSGAPTMQGHDVAKNLEMVETFGMTHPVLRDPDGTIGHRYGAEKTPHVFVIDGTGTLVYAGGVDNAPFGEVDGDGPRVDYLAAALAAVQGGTPVPTPSARAWGCTVKYAKG